MQRRPLMSRWRASLGVVAALLALAGGSAFADEEPALFVPGQAVAQPDGALSVLANPAGYGLVAGSDVRFQSALSGAAIGDGAAVTHRKGSGFGGYLALPVAAFGLGASGEWVDAGGASSRIVQRNSVGLSMALADLLHIGAAVKWTQTADASFRRTWDLGLLLRPSRWLAAGARVQALGEQTAAQPEWPTRWTVGVALRPIDGTDRLTATADVSADVSGGPVSAVALSLAGRIVDGFDLIGHWQHYAPGAGQAATDRAGLALRFGFGQLGALFGANLSHAASGEAKPGFAAGLRMSTDSPPSMQPDGDAAVALLLRGDFSEHKGVGGTHFGSTLLALHKISQQAATKVVVIKVESLQADWAQVEELRNAVGMVRKAGKKVIWYGDGLGTRALGMASACDQIWLAPGSAVTAQGVGADFVSLAEALTRVGVAVQVVRYAEHKSAGEMFVNSEPSAELRGYLSHAVQRRWHDLTQWVALGRDVSATALEAALLAGVAYPDAARAAHLIDEVVPTRDVEAKLRALGWLAPGGHLRPWEPLERRRVAWGARPEIAVVEIEGAIGDHREGTSVLGRTLGGTQMAQTIERMQRDADVKAIVARIVSPGGAVYGSEVMREALQKAAEKKPTLASMGGVAASGGFWVSLGADTVFADAGTVTGSIGILTVRPSVAGLYDRLGVRARPFGAGPGAGIESLARPWSPDEIALMHRQLGQFYQQFLQLTASRRKLDIAKLGELAGGRVWFGDEALQHRLVDRQGGLLDALTLATQRAELPDDDPPVVRFVPQASLTQQLRAAFGLASVAEPAQTLLHQLARAAGPWLDAAAVAAAMDWAVPLAASEAPLEALGN